MCVGKIGGRGVREVNVSDLVGGLGDAEAASIPHEICIYLTNSQESE